MRRRVSTRTGLICAATGLTATVLLSGCGLSLVNDDGSSGTPSARPSNSATTGADPTPGASPTTQGGESPTPTTPTPGTTSSDGGGALPNGLTYSGFSARLAKVNKEIPCDRGPVQLTESGPAIRLVGSCGQVTISGDATSVIADQVDSVTVSGSGVVLMTRGIGAVTFTADAFASEVYWLGGQPSVNDSGAGNTARSIPEGP